MTIDTWWLSITKTAYAVAKTKGQTMSERRFVKEIAESVISNFPSAPHLYALEQLTSVGNLQPDLWRDVLAKIDELLEAKNGGSVDGHSSRREEEQGDPRQDSSREDGDPSWGQGSSSGVDESAP